MGARKAASSSLRSFDGAGNLMNMSKCHNENEGRISSWLHLSGPACNVLDDCHSCWRSQQLLCRAGRFAYSVRQFLRPSGLQMPWEVAPRLKKVASLRESGFDTCYRSHLTQRVVLRGGDASKFKRCTNGGDEQQVRAREPGQLRVSSS